MKFAVVLFGLVSAPAFGSPSPMATGNGFGFAVFAPATGALEKFYSHPYRFSKPDPKDEFGEGIEVSQVLKSLSWGSARPGGEYLNQSQIIRGADGSTYFLPFGLKYNALITVAPKDGGCLKVEFSADAKKENILQLPLASGATCPSAWAIVILESPKAAKQAAIDVRKWQAGLNPSQLIQRELNEVEQWRVKPAFKFSSDAEKKLFRQSEIILRMAQNREPNTAHRHGNGLILAALPEGMWFVSWVRDMAYSVVALIRMGHQEEARRALLAYFNARPVGRMQKDVRGYPYQISVVRYFGDGSEEPFFTMEGEPNIEFDNWGLVLWALGEYVDRFGDYSILAESTHRGSVYEVARDFVARPLLGNLDNVRGGGKIVSADTSIWEEHQIDKQHFAFSSAAAINGLGYFARLARATGDFTSTSWVESELSDLRIGFDRSFLHKGFVTGTAERGAKNLYDSAVLEAINFGVVGARPVIEKTIAMMEPLHMVSGGYRRVRGDTDYEKQEFLYSNYALARNYLRLAQPRKAQSIIDVMTKKAVGDHGLIPEMYVSEVNDQFTGAIGEPTGSIPMVGYGAGYFIIYLSER